MLASATQDRPQKAMVCPTSYVKPNLKLLGGAEEVVLGCMPGCEELDATGEPSQLVLAEFEFL